MKVYKIECNIPDGWVQVCEWNENRGKGGAKGKYDSLLNAIKKHEIDFMSAGRPFRYYVRKSEADSYLDRTSIRTPRLDAPAGLSDRLASIERTLGILASKLNGAE